MLLLLLLLLFLRQRSDLLLVLIFSFFFLFYLLLKVFNLRFGIYQKVNTLIDNEVIVCFTQEKTNSKKGTSSVLVVHLLPLVHVNSKGKMAFELFRLRVLFSFSIF